MQTPKDFGCTEVTLAIQLSYEVPVSKAKYLQIVRSSLSVLKFLKTSFDRSDEVDKLMHERFISVTLPRLAPLNEKERELINTSLSFDRDGEAFKRIPDSLSKHPSVHMFQMRVEGDQNAWGKGVGEIDESPEVVLSYLWHLNTIERVRKHEKVNGNLRRSFKVVDE